jgi:cytochrome c5
MSKKTSYLTSQILIILLLSVFLAACGTGNSVSPTDQGSNSTSAPVTSLEAPAALDGNALMQERCSVCHTVDRITSAHKTADKWQTTVERMIGKGAELSTSEAQTLIDYLAQTYP